MLDLLAGWIHQLLYHFDDISGIDFHCGIHVQHSMVKEIFHSGGCSLVVQRVWSDRKNFVHCHCLAQENSDWKVWIPLHLYATNRPDTTLYGLQCQTQFQNIATHPRVWKIRALERRAPKSIWQARVVLMLTLISRSDISFCTLVGTLALSVGYLGNHCLTNAPKTCDDAESQEASSLMLTATFVLGQASGSFLSYFVLKSIW